MGDASHLVASKKIRKGIVWDEVETNKEFPAVWVRIRGLMVSTMYFWRHVYAYIHQHTDTLMSTPISEDIQSLVPEVKCANSSHIKEARQVAYSLSIPKRLRKTKDNTNSSHKKKSELERIYQFSKCQPPKMVPACIWQVTWKMENKS